MRLAAAFLAAAVLWGPPATAQVCTTSTTVVSRGPDVVSSTSATRCEPEAAPAAAPAPQACTQTTTVVRRLDVVVSSNTSIKCDSDGSGAGVNAKAVFAAP